MIVGVDLGGTKVAAALIDDAGRIARRLHAESRAERGPDAIAAGIAGMVDTLARDAETAVRAVGVGVAGQVEIATGLVWQAPNLRWSEFPLGERLRALTQLPVHVLNDVQAATYGEWSAGAAHGVSDAVCLFIGTGVGGGIIANRRLLHGAAGSAGELGHMPIGLAGPPCRCGGRGCLEAYIGGWAIARRAAEAVAARPDTALGDVTPVITASDLARAAAAGDELAQELVREIGNALGAGVVAIVNALNPGALILGGGVAAALPQLIEAAERAIRLGALRVAARAVRVVPPALGGDAGVLGAAAWARDRV